MSDIPTPLAAPVGVPTGPTQFPGDAPTAEPVAEPGTEAPAAVEPVIVVPAQDGASSVVNPPAPYVAPVVAAEGTVVLRVVAPWHVQVFQSSVPGAPAVSAAGTAVPVQFADQVISIGAANGVTIVKR